MAREELNEDLLMLSEKHGREVVLEIGRAFLCEVNLWQKEFATEATQEAIKDSIESNSVNALVHVEGAKSALSLLEESIVEALMLQPTDD